MSQFLSYLMGAEGIQSQELEDSNVEIVKTEGESRMLKIPQENLSQYIELIKEKLSNGFWNEIIGEKEIIFIFKFKSGEVKEIKLSKETEAEIDKLCAEFNNEPPDKTANVYKQSLKTKFIKRSFQTCL